MAGITIGKIYTKAPANNTSDADLLIIEQGTKTKAVKLKDVTVGKAKEATDAKYAAHLGSDGAPLSVGTEKTPIYIDSAGTPKVCPAVAAATADASAYAHKIGTPQAHPAIGNTSTPIFINSDGIATACTDIHATLGNAGSAGIPVYTQGNAVRECANFGICTTATNTMDKAVTIEGFVRKAGAHFYVKFANDGGGTRGTYNLTLNVHDGNNYTGAAPVYVGKYQCGIGAISGGCTYEMLFDGAHYVILNSDIVAQETSDTASYVKKGNGLIKQWGNFFPKKTRATLYLPIPFAASYTIVVGDANGYNNGNDDEGYENSVGINKCTKNSVDFSIPATNYAVRWICIGF
nr:MAG TPA: Putative tail fiber protein fold, Tail fiber, receptor [Caudoviricetes sp.]